MNIVQPQSQGSSLAEARFTALSTPSTDFTPGPYPSTQPSRETRIAVMVHNPRKWGLLGVEGFERTTIIVDLAVDAPPAKENEILYALILNEVSGIAEPIICRASPSGLRHGATSDQLSPDLIVAKWPVESVSWAMSRERIRSRYAEREAACAVCDGFRAFPRFVSCEGTRNLCADPFHTTTFVS